MQASSRISGLPSENSNTKSQSHEDTKVSKCLIHPGALVAQSANNLWFITQAHGMPCPWVFLQGRVPFIMPNTLGNIDDVSLPSKYTIYSRNPPNAFLVDSAERHFCRGRFSHVNVPLFGSASSAEQQDSQQLEAPKPAHSGKHILLAVLLPLFCSVPPWLFPISVVQCFFHYISNREGQKCDTEFLKKLIATP